ncbi:aspartyl/asparaginyl beta-hydroxylase domain-containing protein [Algivirga pacifica]|uniref:Lipid A hydroxylase LpxO n=1 Tax=Algivirga pacifica TaxID=1162670 RepID=A0ABP9D352_9BACT
MLNYLLTWQFFAIAFLITSALYIHFRGKHRHSFLRQLTDHSTFMAPINSLMYLFSSVPGTPYLSLKDFPQLKVFKDNWETIREEALKLEQQEMIKGSDKFDDIGFNSFFRRGWKRFYIRWYNDFHPSAVAHCPKTIEMIQQTPGIKAAMFVVLPAGSKLPQHRDPYAGSLRYHLGLITPNDENCRIVVDQEAYSWRDGEDVLFDETYIHFAENNTEKDRLIFFCDIERPMWSFIGIWLNRFFSWLILASAESPNSESDRVGGLNKAFKYLYQFRVLGKKIKEQNKPIYYTLKYMLFILAGYLVFVLPTQL